MLPRTQRKNRKREVKGYRPSVRIIKTMTDLLQYQDDLDLGADIVKEHKRYLDKEKVVLLNRYIFPSMSNVVFFFRYMSRYPQLRRLFDNDVKDLLGVRRPDPNEGNYGFVLSNLLQSILALGTTDRWYQDQDEKINAKDFRLRIIPVLIESFKAKVYSALSDVLKNPDFSRSWRMISIGHWPGRKF